MNYNFLSSNAHRLRSDSSSTQASSIVDEQKRLENRVLNFQKVKIPEIDIYTNIRLDWDQPGQTIFIRFKWRAIEYGEGDDYMCIYIVLWREVQQGKPQVSIGHNNKIIKNCNWYARCDSFRLFLVSRLPLPWPSSYRYVHLYKLLMD